MAEPLIETYKLFINNFNNMQPWDLQGEINLPGAKIRRDENGNPIPDGDTGRYKSDDLYARYYGVPVRAGFFSNFVVGYISEKQGLERVEPFGGGQAVAVYAGLKKKELKSDNPKDSKASDLGWVFSKMGFPQGYIPIQVIQNALKEIGHE